jgi:hypothetical protein
MAESDIGREFEADTPMLSERVRGHIRGKLAQSDQCIGTMNSLISSLARLMHACTTCGSCRAAACILLACSRLLGARGTTHDIGSHAPLILLNIVRTMPHSYLPRASFLQLPKLAIQSGECRSGSVRSLCSTCWEKLVLYNYLAWQKSHPCF